MVLEDDAVFVPFAKRIIRRALMDLERLAPDWDFLYLGRKVRVLSCPVRILPYHTEAPW